MDKKRIYFLIASIIIVLMSIVSIMNVDVAREQALEAISMVPESMQKRMEAVYSSNKIFIFPNVLSIIFASTIFIVALKNSLSQKKGLILGLSIATLLLSDNTLSIILMIANIIIISKVKKENVRHQKKEIPTLDRIDTSNKNVLGGIFCLVIYFSQIFLPVSASKTTNYIISILFYIVLLIICIFMFKTNLKRDIKLLKENFKAYISFLLPKLGIMYLSYIVTSVICVYVLNQGISVNQQSVESLPLYVSFPLAVFWAPIVEEILFRGCLRRLIKNDKLFIIMSGLIFGLLHTMHEPTLFSAITMMLPYGLLGGFFAYFYVKTNNITTNMMCHCFHNTTIMLLQIVLF